MQHNNLAIFETIQPTYKEYPATFFQSPAIPETVGEDEDFKVVALEFYGQSGVTN